MFSVTRIRTTNQFVSTRIILEKIRFEIILLEIALKKNILKTCIPTQDTILNPRRSHTQSQNVSLKDCLKYLIQKLPSTTLLLGHIEIDYQRYFGYQI